VPANRVEYELYIRDNATGQIKKLSDVLGSAGEKGASAAKKITRYSKDANREMRKLSSSASQLEKTLGRLQRTIVAFMGVWAFRKITQGFAGLVRSGIEFNKTMEQTRIGIGAVLAAQTRITDAMGRELRGREKILAAQKVAVKIQQDLLQANLKTAATYQQLITMFQQALPHALAEGFSIKQVEEFVTAMSQAATAMDIPLNMMAEEMRAMLKGTITAKNTLIATALGMEKDVIKRLQGRSEELFDYIMGRLRAFQLSSPDVLSTWEATFTNMKQAFSQSIGEALQEFFEVNKDTMRELADFFRSENFKEGVKALGELLLKATELAAKMIELAGEEHKKNVVPFEIQSALATAEGRLKVLKEMKEIAEGGGGLKGKALRLFGGVDRTAEDYQREIDLLIVKIGLLREEEQEYIKKNSAWYKKFLELQKQLHNESFKIIAQTKAGEEEREKALEDYAKKHVKVVDRIKKSTLDETNYKLWKLKEWYEATKKVYEKAGKDTTELKLQYIREQLEIEDEAAQKIEKIREDLVDKTKKFTLSEVEYKKWALAQEIKALREKAKGNKELLDTIERYYKAALANIDKEAAEKAAKAREKAEKEFKRMLERIQDATADTLYDIFTGAIDSWKDLWDRAKDYFLRVLAEMAAKAAMTKIIIPIVTVASSGGGRAYAATGGNISELGLIKSIPGIGGFLNTPVLGTAYANNVPGAQVPTWGGVLAAAGLGSFGYGTLGNWIGLPQSKYSPFTSGAGAGLGFAVGGPIGAGIGALIGGTLGGLFGRDKVKKFYMNWTGSGFQWKRVPEEVQKYITDTVTKYQDALIDMLGDATEQVFLTGVKQPIHGEAKLKEGNLKRGALNIIERYFEHGFSQIDDVFKTYFEETRSLPTEQYAKELERRIQKASQFAKVAERFPEMYDALTEATDRSIDNILQYYNQVAQIEDLQASLIPKYKSLSETGAALREYYAKIYSLPEETLSEENIRAAKKWLETANPKDVVDAAASMGRTVDELISMIYRLNDALDSLQRNLTATINAQYRMATQLGSPTQAYGLAVKYIASKYSLDVAQINKELMDKVVDWFITAPAEQVMDTLEALGVTTDELVSDISLFYDSLERLSNVTKTSTTATNQIVDNAEAIRSTLLSLASSFYDASTYADYLLYQLGERFNTNLQGLSLEAVSDKIKEVLLMSTKDIESIASDLGITAEEYIGTLNSIYSALSAVKDEQARLAEEYNSLVDQYRNEIIDSLRQEHERLESEFEEAKRAYVDALQSTVDALENAVKDIKDYIGELSSTDEMLSPTVRLAKAHAMFSSVARQALSGDTEALAKLPEASSDFLEASMAVAGTWEDYARDFAEVMKVLNEAQALGERAQKTYKNELETLGVVAESTADLKKLESEYYAAKKALDESLYNQVVLADAQKISWLEKINATMEAFNLSVMEAINKVASDAATEAMRKNSPTTSTADLYSELHSVAQYLGLNQTQEQILYTSQGVAEALRRVKERNEATIAYLNSMQVSAGTAEYLLSTLYGKMKASGFQHGGVVSGPVTGYTVPVTFHGREYITPEEGITGLKNELEEIKEILTMLMNTNGDQNSSLKKIYNIMDRVNQGNTYLRVSSV